MIISKNSFPKPIFWGHGFLTRFEEKNESKKISTVIWDRDESVICDQIIFAFENNVDVILSELLPTELPTSLSNLFLEFFRDRFIFEPPNIKFNERLGAESNDQSIVLIQDGLIEDRNTISLLKKINHESNNFLKEINIDYDDIHIEDIFHKLGDSDSFIISIQSPTLISCIVFYLTKQNKKIKLIEGHFNYSHRFALMGYYVKECNPSDRNSIRKEITFCIKSKDSILQKSNSLKAFIFNANSFEVSRIPSCESHFKCDGLKNTLNDLIDIPMFNLISHKQFQPVLTSEQKRFLIYYISINIENHDELNSDFVQICLKEFLLNTYHSCYIKFISDIISISPNVIPLLTNIALQSGINSPNLVTHGALGEALIFSGKFNNSENDSITNDSINKIFLNEYKSINDLFHYHQEFITIENSKCLDFFISILNSSTRKKESFSRLLFIVPTKIDFKSWSTEITTENISDNDFDILVQGYLLNQGIIPGYIPWIDDDDFNKTIDSHIENLTFLHNARPYCSNVLNFIFLRRDPSFYSSLVTTPYHRIDHDVYHLLNNSDINFINEFYSNQNPMSDFTILHLFLNHFIRILPFETKEELHKINTTDQIFDDLVKIKWHLGYLKFLCLQYNHPLSSDISLLNERLNPYYKQMDKRLTSLKSLNT